MIHIRINLESIHIVGTKYEKCEFDFPNDLIVQYGEKEFPIDSWSVCYKFDSELLFPYLDDFERRMPKTSHSIWWDWSGIRKGSEYYIELTATALSEDSKAFIDAFKEVFSQHLENSEAFELPEIDAPFQFESYQEWNEEEPIDFDEDDKLRLLEELTAGNDYIQWTRIAQEYGGSTDVSTRLGATAALAGFGYSFLKDFFSLAAKQYYKRKINTLLKSVVDACKNKGRFVLPEPKPPEIYNAESREKEYVFTQLLDDGRWREIYISEDGERITKGHFHNSNKK